MQLIFRSNFVKALNFRPIVNLAYSDKFKFVKNCDSILCNF